MTKIVVNLRGPALHRRGLKRFLAFFYIFDQKIAAWLFWDHASRNRLTLLWTLNGSLPQQGLRASPLRSQVRAQTRQRILHSWFRFSSPFKSPRFMKQPLFLFHLGAFRLLLELAPRARLLVFGQIKRATDEFFEKQNLGRETERRLWQWVNYFECITVSLLVTVAVC